MNYTFDTEVEKVFLREGYRSDDPDDPGRLTIWGISHRSFPDDVRAMDQMGREEAKAYAKGIYKANFWDRCGAEAVIMEECGSTAVQMFDLGITSGNDTAIELLQSALNGLGGNGYKWQRLTEDGILGGATLTSLRACLNWNKPRAKRALLLARVFQTCRASFYLNLSKSRPTNGKFIDGWLNRTYSFILE